MKRIFSWVLTPCAILIGIILAVANRQSVNLSLDPFSQTTPALSVGMPLYVVIFLFLLIGILIGGTSTWARAGRSRKLARAHKRQQRKEEKSQDIKNLPATD